MVMSIDSSSQHPIRASFTKGTARVLVRQLELAINRHRHFAGAGPLPELEAFKQLLTDTILENA